MRLNHKCDIKKPVKNVDNTYHCRRCGKDITKEILTNRKWQDPTRINL